MAETADVPSVRVVPLAGVGDSISAALDGSSDRSLVVIGCPGDTAETVLTAARLALTTADVDATEWVALRSDRGDAAAYARRNDLGLRTGAVVASDLQWLHDDALADVLEAAIAPGANGPFVAIHRHGVERPGLAELRNLALRSHRLIDVGLASPASLVSAGVEADEAERRIAATGGSPVLLELLDDDAAFDAEVVARLATIGDSARRTSELLAFGLDAALLAGSGLLADAGELDGALAQLRLEGLVFGTAMPSRVAQAVRAACPPGRRGDLVAAVSEHGPAGSGHDLAGALLAEGDRSPASARLYADAALSMANGEPARALDFATAAVAAGADRAEVAVAVGVARLGLGDPAGAIEAVGAGGEPDRELVRSAAWIALGDLVAASESALRSSHPPLARWAELGLGGASGTGSAAPSAVDAAERVAAVLDRWWRATGEHTDGLLDDLQRATIGARADGSADHWPVAPELVGVQIAARDGEFATAGRLAARADVGAMHAGTRLALLAWVEARRGHLDAADEALADLEERATSPHDRLIAAGARCAAAVRESDGERLDAAVGAAQAALDDLPPHLHLLDTVADVASAASRSRVDVGDVLARCERYAARDPEGRGVADVARARLVAALAGDDLDAIAAAGTAILELESGRDDRWRSIAEILAAPAEADANAVIDVARELADSEASYEAARVCGVVALSTSDADVSRKLLRESRVWRTARRQVAAAAGVDRSVVALSEQEERVGRLVLDGHTHKQVGAELFISPKTVEHHVAHIRTKLGCANRAEMMIALRDYLQ